MKNRIKISDFVILTGSTLKTVMYYHKIGLLKEPERSPKGYRLYGTDELYRMQLINYLKLLGLDLKRIKEILGDTQNNKTLREVLTSFQQELLIEKKNLEQRLSKIEMLLKDDTVSLDKVDSELSSFQMIGDILGTEKIEEYYKQCPEVFEQQRKVYGILDNFKWGEEYQTGFYNLARYFKEHPDEYQTSLAFGVRLEALSKLSPDDPEVDALAKDSARFIKGIPELRKILCKQSVIKKPLSNLYNEMAGRVISPAQVRHGELLQKYLLEED
ncbi:MAG: MerR family transcriptional regulator [Solirubrobacterales bacterium]